MAWISHQISKNAREKWFLESKFANFRGFFPPFFEDIQHFKCTEKLLRLEQKEIHDACLSLVLRHFLIIFVYSVLYTFVSNGPQSRAWGMSCNWPRLPPIFAGCFLACEASFAPLTLKSAKLLQGPKMFKKRKQTHPIHGHTRHWFLSKLHYEAISLPSILSSSKMQTNAQTGKWVH